MKDIKIIDECDCSKKGYAKYKFTYDTDKKIAKCWKCGKLFSYIEVEK